MNTTPEDYCKTAIKVAGGPGALARRLGSITSQAVSQWRVVPAARVMYVEKITDISRHDLRPDIFGKWVGYEP